MVFTLRQIANLIQGDVLGDADISINMLAKIQDAKSGQLTFLSNLKYEHYIYTTQASAVIVQKNFKPKSNISAVLILVEDPYSSFARLLDEYLKLVNFNKVGIESPSYIGKDTTVGKDVYRGAFTYIGNNVTIGDNVKIFPHSYIGDNVTIGNQVILHANVKLYERTVIKNNCVIHAGAVIGSDGFGFAPQEDGSYKTIPQLGNVIIEDDVVIGANTTVDCATFSGDSTIIGKGAKLDNLIQIGHNVEIGENTVIAAQAGISGSTKIGQRCMIAGQVGLAGHLTIANNTSFGAQSGIMKNVVHEGQKLMGTPAIDVKHYFRSYSAYKDLPNIIDRLNNLEKKIQPSQK